MNITSVARKSLFSDGKRARKHQRALFRFVKNLVAKSRQNRELSGTLILFPFLVPPGFLESLITLREK